MIAARAIEALARVGMTAALALAAVAGCGGASPLNGLDAYFRATGAQFVQGELVTDANAVGPQVHVIGGNNNRLYPGVQNKAISGTVEESGSAVAIGLAGDGGYWIVPTGSVDIMSPPDLTFSTRGSFSLALPSGAHDLIFRAVDKDGNIGPSKTQALTLDAAAATGAFVISLVWGGPADLDLHVVAPATGGPGSEEIWTRKRSSLSSKRAVTDPPFTPAEIAGAGTLDFDSNSACFYDGRNNENVVWKQAPPSGHYIVRVDAASLCGAASAVWGLTVLFNNEVVGQVSGEMGDTATQVAHVAGAGLTVWERDVL